MKILHQLAFLPSRLDRRFQSLFILISLATSAVAQTIQVDITPSHAVNKIVPTTALGAGIDRIPKAAADHLFTSEWVQRVLTSGWQTITYRQNTELHVQAWHWNPQGTWSEPGDKGYFTGNANPGKPIRESYGYNLPHRGFTRNDGTGSSGYSRLDDGGLDTYWKSNPYLTKTFTGEDDTLHPQWVVLDFATSQALDSLRIAWDEPYARKYVVQYWTGELEPIHFPTKGRWEAFPSGTVDDGKGGTVTLRLAPSPINARYVRIWLTESSNTCDTHAASDKRNCVGFAIRELYAGTTSSDGEFHDSMRHTPDQDQTTTYCSSVDPWHKASDIDQIPRIQLGFDFFYQSGYTRGLPAMIPVSLAYGTPEDSAAQIAYIEARRYSISYIEMGEEADGQFMLPEDYGALYLQWATALHKVDPALKLGGPVFTGQNKDIEVWPDAQGRTSWLGRFLIYLKAHGRIQDLAFYPFEHYPFVPCTVQWSSLYDEPALISHIMDVWRSDGLPPNVPMFVTETNLSWESGESFPDIFGALWEADYVGAFFAAGGSGTYYFHYLPEPLGHGCNNSIGTFAMFSVDKNYQFEQPLSQFFASQMLTQQWMQPGNGEHTIFPAASDVIDATGRSLVTAYVAKRPDGQYSVMLVNKDQFTPHTVHIRFNDADNNTGQSFYDTVTVSTFGKAQYQWHPTASGGKAQPDGPIAHSTMTANDGTGYLLPEASVTVIRGALGGRP
jgi:hypothetical protein